VQPPRLPQLACSAASLPPLQCSLPADTIAPRPHWLRHLPRSLLAASLAAQSPCLPHLRCSLSAATPAAQAHRLPRLQCNLSDATIAAQPYTPRTFSMVPGVGHWPRSLRGHHCAARGASPCLVLTHLSTAAGKSCCFVASLGRRPRQRHHPALAPPTEENRLHLHRSPSTASSRADPDVPRYKPPPVHSPTRQCPSCKSPTGNPSPKTSARS